jgi:uncharacterized protein (TIGR00266 family)
VDFVVKGTVLPVLEATLQPGESLISTHGDLGWMTSTIQLSQTTGGKGIFKAAKRMVGGAGLFLTRYTSEGGPGTIVFPAKLPGTLISVPVTPQQSYFVHRSGFLCGTEGIEASVAMQQKLGSAFLGGMGFFLQHLTGEGEAWLELSGEMFSYDLEAGTTLRVHPSHVGAFTEGVDFSITTIPGIKNKMFGGNGFFVASLTGPGRVWLQSMSISQLAAEIGDYLPTNDSGSGGGGGFNLGSGINSILGN